MNVTETAVPLQAQILVTREKARLDYLGMGCDRSLAKLHQAYTSAGLDSPSLSTLKSWSGNEGWQGMAELYDRSLAKKVQQELVDRVAVEQVKTTLNAQEKLSHCVEEGISKALHVLNTANIVTLSDGHRALKLAADAMEMKERLRNSTLSRDLPSLQHTGKDTLKEIDAIIASVLKKNESKAKGLAT